LPTNHGLPPDNCQETPDANHRAPYVATNIGRACSRRSRAHDFGFIDTKELVNRADATMTSIEALERFERPSVQLVRLLESGAAQTRAMCPRSTAATSRHRC